MTAISEQISLPFSLSPSSSLTDSKIRPIHSADCSLRPQKSHIKLKEEWWGPLDAGSERTLESKLGNSEERRESKRRRTATREDDPVSSKKGKEDDRGNRRSRTEQEDVENVSKSESSSGRRRREASHQAHSRRDERRCTQSSKSQASRSRSPPRSRHSRSSFPLLQRSPTPLPLRSAVSILYTPIRALQQSIAPSDYDPYLTQDPIDPLYSFSFHRAQVEFFCASSPVYNWSQRPDSGVFKAVSFWPLNGRLIGIQPDLEKIRSELRLKSVDLNLSQQERNHPSWGQLIEVLKWIYGRKVVLKEVYWFVENAPDALLALGSSQALHSALSRTCRQLTVSCPSSVISPPSCRYDQIFGWCLLSRDRFQKLSTVKSDCLAHSNREESSRTATLVIRRCD